MLFCSFICINILVFLTKPLLQTPGVFLTSTSIAEFSPHPSEFNFRLSPNSHLVENILQDNVHLEIPVSPTPGVSCPQCQLLGMCRTHDIPARFIRDPSLRVIIYSGTVVIHCYYFCTPDHFFVVQMRPNMSDSAIRTSVQIQIIMCV